MKWGQIYTCKARVLKQWNKDLRTLVRLPIPFTGMYIGHRSVAEEGSWQWDGPSWSESSDDDGSWHFETHSRRRVLLFVESERHNPVWVFPEDVVDGLE